MWTSQKVNYIPLNALLSSEGINYSLTHPNDVDMHWDKWVHQSNIFVASKVGIEGLILAFLEKNPKFSILEGEQKKKFKWVAKLLCLTIKYQTFVWILYSIMMPTDCWLRCVSISFYFYFFVRELLCSKKTDRSNNILLGTEQKCGTHTHTHNKAPHIPI